MAVGASFLWSPEIRRALSCAARQASEAGQPVDINGPNALEIADRHARTRVNDNIDKLLLKIASLSGRPGGVAKFYADKDFTLIDCYGQAEFEQYLNWIQEAGLASYKRIMANRAQDGSAIYGSGFELSLTVEGWNRIQPLPQLGGIPGRCFVAMWFDDSMVDVFELGISKAVTECGFPAPVRIDRKEHNNQITDEIIAAIRESEFIIADFTGNRGGVYYEAGFARGLGRPVIYCCRDSNFDDRHFDTKLINHIKWCDVPDLREKLTNRIKATIIPRS